MLKEFISTLKVLHLIKNSLVTCADFNHMLPILEEHHNTSHLMGIVRIKFVSKL